MAGKKTASFVVQRIAQKQHVALLHRVAFSSIRKEITIDDAEPGVSSKFSGEIPFKSKNISGLNRHKNRVREKPNIIRDEVVKSRFGSADDRVEYEDDDAEFTPFVVKKQSPIYFRDLCKRLADEGKIADAVAVVEKRMYEDRVRPEKFNYTTLIHILARAGQARKAMEFFRKMRTAGYYPGFKTVTSLMNACANAPMEESEYALEQTKWLLERERNQYGAPRDSTIYYAAMKCCARHNDLESLFRFADDMIRDGFPITCDVFSYLLSAAISDREAGFQLALQVWRTMRSLNLKFELFHYNLVLMACRKSGLGERSNALLSTATKKNRALLTAEICTNHKLMSDQTTEISSTCMTNDSKAEQPQSTSSIQSFDVNTATTVEKIRFSLLGGFEQIKVQMNKDKITADLKFCTNILSLLPDAEEYESKLMQFAKENNVKFDTEFFNLLIFRRAMRHDENLTLACIDELRRHKLLPNVRTFEALALTCRNSFQCLRLLKDMTELGLKPSKRLFRTCWTKALKKFDFIYLRDTLSQMSKFGVDPDEHMLEAIENKLAEVRSIRVREKESVTRQLDALNLQKIVGYEEFLQFYDGWLKQRRFSYKNSTDPRLTMLNKNVKTDDLREDWEKPWAFDDQNVKKREKLADDRIEIVP